VLWVRSHWQVDCINLRQTFSVFSTGGCVNAIYDSSQRDSRWYVVFPAHVLEQPSGSIFGFYFRFDAPAPHKGFWLGFPDWFVLVILVIASAVPWLRLRFTVRTLLIATTLVAVVLGLIVWAAKS
jgi:hypothetical protein